MGGAETAAKKARNKYISDRKGKDETYLSALSSLFYMNNTKSFLFVVIIWSASASLFWFSGLYHDGTLQTSHPLYPLSPILFAIAAGALLRAYHAYLQWRHLNHRAPEGLVTEAMEFVPYLAEHVYIYAIEHVWAVWIMGGVLFWVIVLAYKMSKNPDFRGLEDVSLGLVAFDFPAIILLAIGASHALGMLRALRIK
jgi:hypothetical protein